MENLIFAGNAVAPTFVVIALGFWLKSRGILTGEFISRGNALCFQVLFPILVFFNLYDAEKIDFTYLKPILFALCVIVVCVSSLMVLVPRLVRERKQQGVLVQSVYRGNYMLYGLPFSRSLGGEPCVALATSIMAATLPLLNVIGVFVYSFFAETGEKPDLKRAAVNAMKNPIIWGVVLGAAFYGFRIPMPSFLHAAGKDLAKIVTPFSFLLLGGQFRFSSAKNHWKPLAVGIVAKLVILPVVFLWIAVSVLDIRGDTLVPVFIFLAAPTAITNYQMAVQFDADYELAGDFLVYSMVFSAFTMFFFIFFLKTWGLIG